MCLLLAKAAWLRHTHCKTSAHLSTVRACVQWSRYSIQLNLSIETTIGTQLAVLYTVELSIEATIGTQLAVLYTVELSIEATIGTQLAVLYTVESLYRGHLWDQAGCPVYRDSPTSDLYTALCGLDCRQCPH